MTMNQQDKEALTQNWDQARQQLQAQFPGISEQDLDDARSNPDQAVSKLAQASGQTEDQVRQSLTNVAKQFSGQSSGQRQS